MFLAFLARGLTCRRFLFRFSAMAMEFKNLLDVSEAAMMFVTQFKPPFNLLKLSFRRYSH